MLFRDSLSLCQSLNTFSNANNPQTGPRLQFAGQSSKDSGTDLLSHDKRTSQNGGAAPAGEAEGTGNGERYPQTLK